MAAQKDTSLGQMLQGAGIGMSAADVEALIRGVAAAPDSDQGGNHGAEADWLRLIFAKRGKKTEDPLRRRLEQMLAEFRGSMAMDAPSKSTGARRIRSLRAELKRQKLDGFVIPLADEHQGEYVAKRARRLAWLTGFTGSAGIAVVLARRAAIFVDGRYTLQARDQVDAKIFERHHLTDSPPDRWIAKHLPAGKQLGFDPWLHTVDDAARLRLACKKSAAKLTPVKANPVDQVWTDQPPPPLALITKHGARYAGRSSLNKRSEIAKLLRREKQDAAVLTAPDSIAWLLNLRGGDIPYTPLALSFALVHADRRVELFVDQRKFGPNGTPQFDELVEVAGPSSFGGALDRLGKAGKTIAFDPSGTNEAIHERLRKAGATLVRGNDPCAQPKATKNQKELAGTRAAHLRDGVALTKFLAWLGPAARKGDLDELGAAATLDEFRRDNEFFRGLSFPTISGAGPNAAIVHYQASEATNRKLSRGELYLVDSGAQYLDGTTDVTRTVAIGRPSAEMKDRFTRVLKGHIAIATARFPAGTSGSQLDTLARRELWEAGLDYDHGTGHGVGSYLSVHEGPQRISKIPSRIALEPGMIVSNEPGYYKTGAYGIRIENLLAVKPLPAPPGAEKSLLGFETLTLAPIDINLIEASKLAPPEAAWLNAYHDQVRARLTPLLDAPAADWLKKATRHLK